MLIHLARGVESSVRRNRCVLPGSARDPPTRLAAALDAAAQASYGPAPRTCEVGVQPACASPVALLRSVNRLACRYFLR